MKESQSFNLYSMPTAVLWFVYENKSHLKGPPRSPDITPYDFNLWSYIKDSVYVTHVPATLQNLLNRIVTALNSITRVQLIRVRQKTDY